METANPIRVAGSIGSALLSAREGHDRGVLDCGLDRLGGAVLADTMLYCRHKLYPFLPTGIAQYKAAIVFLPGLRDPATGNPLDSRGLVSGTSSGACSIWCAGEKAVVRSRALGLAGGNVALLDVLHYLTDEQQHLAHMVGEGLQYDEMAEHLERATGTPSPRPSKAKRDKRRDTPKEAAKQAPKQARPAAAADDVDATPLTDRQLRLSAGETRREARDGTP